MMRALVAGATGFVGTKLVERLLADGVAVRCVARDRDRAAGLAASGCEVVQADLSARGVLQGAMAGVDIAYFLVHMMGGEGDYPERERVAAEEFARAAKEAGVERIIYLGGLGSDPGSRHLRSRDATARTLRELGPPLTYFRAGMVIGPGSESFELLRSIVARLPALPAPDWLEAETQPIGIRDVVAYLAAAPQVPESAGREIEIGGPEVVTYLDLVDEMGRHMGQEPKRRLGVSGRVARPRAIAAGAAAVTTGTPEVAAEISLGLPERTVVEDRSGMALFEIEPEPLSAAIGRALVEDEELARTEE